ncbi:hypothetical protein BD779DRAFT_1685311 [Infundibulicybe gibba]|nr:hypothetical protein BD779DRAFT_1685311 [Infundibulicybe gibba]
MARAAKFKFLYPKNSSVSAKPSAKRHRHTLYSEAGNGRVTVATSFISSHQSTTASEGDKSNEVVPPETAKDSPAQWENEGICDPLLDPAYIDHVAEISLEPTKRERTAGDEPLIAWIPHCERFLEEFISLEGRGWAPPSTCLDCLSGPADHECLDCYGRGFRCATCIVSKHQESPLHRVRFWNGAYFEERTLKGLGLRIQLGHRPGKSCINPVALFNDDFTILDNKGIFSVALDFCACGEGTQSRPLQLLRARLFPATTSNPQSAATFRVLETLEMLSYTSKVSVFEFYQALSRSTDNTKMKQPPDRYPQLLRMIRQWRHLKLLKRAGCGHNPLGTAAIQSGECAVLCPACPQGDKNMPSGWKNVPKNEKYIHSLFLAIDANFRLRRKDVSSNKADPSLSQGYSYFVEEREYKEYLRKCDKQPEPKSTCSRHDAVNLAGSKSNRSVATTGVGAVVCARHGMNRPNSVADLQYGERYCNMDYIFYKSMQNTEVVQLVVSYDIVCQWSVHLKKRMFALDHTFDILNGGVLVKFLVPKFHLPAHVAACRTQFSFNLTKGVGRTDGEAPEHAWSDADPLAPSTKEMGPGSRRDTLDFHFGDSNWRKLTGLGITLMRRLKAAATDMTEYAISHKDLEASLPTASLSLWQEELDAWEDDPTICNPFEVTSKTPTQTSARRELSEAEARDLIVGKDVSLDENVLPSVLISSGMDLEAEQRVIKISSGKLWDHSQDCQRTRLQIRTNALQRKIENWFKILQIYIPPVAMLRQRSGTAQKSGGLKPDEIILWLPSQIGESAPFNKRLAEIEWKLRIGQAYESLDGLRSNLQIRSHLFKFKDKFIRGQASNTRARNTINLIQARVDASGEEYCVARLALVTLAKVLGKIGWQV